jgi:hypothetical protein
MRAGDTERQATVDVLTEHFTAGRLTASEYDERVRQAYASTYLDELPALLADLPTQDSARGAEPGYGRAAAGSGPWGGSDPWDGSVRWGGPGARPGPGRWNGPGPWRSPRGRAGRMPGGPPRAGALLAIAAVVLLLVLSHGFVLFPLLWIGFAVLFFGRRRGGCGRRMAGPRSAP